MAISVEPDGVYCGRYHTLHPTLMWHEPYDECATREIQMARWSANVKKRPGRFKDAVFKDMNAARNLYEGSDEQPCVICGRMTRFVDTVSKLRVCSDACRSRTDCGCPK